MPRALSSPAAKPRTSSHPIKAGKRASGSGERYLTDSPANEASQRLFNRREDARLAGQPRTTAILNSDLAFSLSGSRLRATCRPWLQYGCILVRVYVVFRGLAGQVLKCRWMTAERDNNQLHPPLKMKWPA